MLAFLVVYSLPFGKVTKSMVKWLFLIQ